MGHASVSNLSEFFINRLYAKGKLSLKEACEQAEKAGEFLHASEGDYEEACSIAIGMTEIFTMLSSADPAGRGYSGFKRNAGPWIVPDLSPWRGNKSSLSKEARHLVKGCEEDPEDGTLPLIAADKVEEEGFEDWAAFLRLLPRFREALEKWWDPEGDIHEDELDDGWTVFDHIPWKFAPGVRRGYKEVPRLDHITN